MPNHITNIVQASKTVIESMVVDGKPDFNAIIPAPECLKDFQPHMGVVSRAEAAMGIRTRHDDHSLLSKLEAGNTLRDASTPVADDDIEEIIKAIRCYQECGHVYWHTWNSEEWGTKWNAYNSNPERCNENHIHFETAWSMPKKVAVALSKKFPDENITWQYADEDMGYNCGTIVLRGGDIVSKDVNERGSNNGDVIMRRWREFAFRLRHLDADISEYGLDKNFNYIEEE